MNYLDYKQLTESDFFKNKFAKKEKEEEEKLNKSENDVNFNQKIKEINSAPALIYKLLITKLKKIMK